MIDKLRCVVFLVWMPLLIAGASILRAQTYGEITGTITDASGAIVGAAGVSVSNVANNQTRRVTTNESGNFTIPFLAPGLYDIRVEKEGFKTDTRKGVDLQVGAVARLNFTLEVCAVTPRLSQFLPKCRISAARRSRRMATWAVRSCAVPARGTWTCPCSKNSALLRKPGFSSALKRST